MIRPKTKEEQIKYAFMIDQELSTIMEVNVEQMLTIKQGYYNKGKKKQQKKHTQKKQWII